MLQEILLSLSGHPSPLLQVESHESPSYTALNPAERDLLSTAGRLSDLHIRLTAETGRLARESSGGGGGGGLVVRAVATTIETVHLAAWRRTVLDVEAKILRGDAELVGGYDIVPLTAVIAEFSGWARRLEWLWVIAQFISGEQGGKQPRKGGDGQGPVICTGAALMNKLRGEIRSGYQDIEETASSLLKSAEVAWLKQVSAWVLYGRLPSFGAEDFFVRASKEDGDETPTYMCDVELLPGFVPPSTAASMLFIGRCLNHARVKTTLESGPQGRQHIAAQLRTLSSLTYPLRPAALARAVSQMRLSLSRTTLQQLLPPARVVEVLALLRDFFLLARGEFAMALTHEADERNRGRWRRAENLAHEQQQKKHHHHQTKDKDGGVAVAGGITVKQGEVARVLAKTWAGMGAMQGLHAGEDEGLELARDLLRLQLTKSKPATPLVLGGGRGRGRVTVASTPFRNLLFSSPVVLTLSEIPSPLDMFLAPADVQAYSAINAYLLSIRRAHIRLTDLWKITTLRRHHPAPPPPPGGSTRRGRAQVRLLRERHTARSLVMRSAWVASSATVFFLAETEAYMQAEVVAGLWDGFHAWLKGTEPASQGGARTNPTTATTPTAEKRSTTEDQEEAEEEDEDIWLSTPDTKAAQEKGASSDTSRPPQQNQNQHDPETLAMAHRAYLAALASHLLLTRPTFTDRLYELLTQTERLVGLVRRLDGTWTAMDLESDEGVVADAFADLAADEGQIRTDLAAVGERVRRGIGDVVAALRALEADDDDAGFAAELEGAREDAAAEAAAAMAEDEGGGGGGEGDGGRYVPRRVGGVNRLLMKLDFGVWFGDRDEGVEE